MNDKPSGWLGRLRAGLGKSSSRLAGGIGSILSDRKLDAETLGDLEDLLITADLGVETAARLIEQIWQRRFPADVPEAARAVGQAVGSNPLPLLIPCHRVLRATGAIGGYRWGTSRKMAMLGRELCRPESAHVS